MIKVTLLGDSIRMIGYGLLVPELLGDEYEVFQPNVNCKFAKNTLRGLFDWSKDMYGSRIIHWNNGLWDVCNLFGDGLFTSEAEYVDNMLRIADILVAKYDKVIFATTTPVARENQYNKNADIKRYNDLIVPLLVEKGIIINDLYSVVLSDVDKYIRKDDNIHLSEEGIAICSKQVADIIRAVAESLEDDVSEKVNIYRENDDSNGAPV
jgi:hypothetical protein